MNNEKRILILDDEGSIRELLKEVLEEAGYTVLSSSAPGITAIKAYKADVILLDLHMANSNEKQGLDVLTHLWEDQDLTIPIIIYSAYAGFEDTTDEIREIEELYGNGRKVYASINKGLGLAPLLDALEKLFGTVKLP